MFHRDPGTRSDHGILSMSYQETNEASLYLLSTLQFHVGKTPVRLYGGVKVGGNEFAFVLADKLNPSFVPPEFVDPTESIANPFEMTGVTLGGFEAAGHIKKVKGETVFDLVLRAKAELREIGLMLDGALVFEKSSPRLILVTLNADRPLTLTDFVKSVLGWNWDWMDDVTRQFAFREGTMYYLSSTEKSWEYPAGGGTYFPGYHISARLRLFQSYDFSIQLHANVQDKAIDLTGTIEKLDFDFVSFQEPKLQISSKAGSSRFTLSTEKLIVLGTTFDVKATYQAGVFRGRVAKKFDVDIPGIGRSSQTVDLAVGFAWTSGTNGFRITEISGLPTGALDLAKEFEKYLNEIRSGGCERIITGWLKDICKTTLVPGLDGSPSRVDGNMKLPLKLTYTIDLGGRPMTPQVIQFSAVFVIPKSLESLPGAMWGSVVRSVPSIVEDILKNPDTYKALAVACAMKYGASAAARFICRAVDQFARDVAQSIATEAAAAASAAAADVAGAAELAAAIASFTAGVASDIVKSFLDWISEIWDEITEPITHNREKREREDNARIAALGAQIKAAMDNLWAQVNKLAATQPVTELKVRVDADQYVAQWTRNPISSPPGAVLKYELQLLSGSVGDPTGAQWPETTARIEPADRASVSFPTSDIPNYGQFKWNASIRGSITGIPFLTPQTAKDISKAISVLRDAKLSKATELANQLDADLERLRGYDKSGVTTAPIYAVLDIPALMTVGQSRIGVNTRIRSK